MKWYTKSTVPKRLGERKELRHLAPKELFAYYWKPDDITSCWNWIGGINRGGYGLFYSAERRSRLAHRTSWELHRGPIPKGMQIDHMCRNRSCVNPDHLRVVTPGQNTLENSLNFTATHAAKTHCPKGHPFSGNNLRRRFVPSQGWIRECITCVRQLSTDGFYRRNQTLRHTTNPHCPACSGPVTTPAKPPKPQPALSMVKENGILIAYHTLCITDQTVFTFPCRGPRKVVVLPAPDAVSK